MAAKKFNKKLKTVKQTTSARSEMLTVSELKLLRGKRAKGLKVLQQHYGNKVKVQEINDPTSTKKSQ
jgi:hypothetical protein